MSMLNFSNLKYHDRFVALKDNNFKKVNSPISYVIKNR